MIKLIAIIDETEPLGIIAAVRMARFELHAVGQDLVGAVVPKEGFDALRTWIHQQGGFFDRLPPGLGWQPDRMHIDGVTVKPQTIAETGRVRADNGGVEYQPQQMGVQNRLVV